MKGAVAALWAGMVAMASGAASAVSIVAVTPQGEVAQVRQVTVKFSDAVVAFGDPRLADPVAIACQGGVPAGAGRWANDRVWLYDFREPLGPGASCTVTARNDWKPAPKAGNAAAPASAAGATTLTGTTRFAFSTGGPAVVAVQPGGGNEVEEDQHFLLRLNGAAVEASVVANAWCGFLPSIYVQSGIAGAAVGVLTATVAAANMLGNIGSGRLLQRGVAPSRLLTIGFATMGLAATAGFAGGSGGEGGLPPALRYVAVLLFSGVGGLIPATLFALAVRLAPGEGTLATTLGWVQQWSALGQFAGPPAVATVASAVGGWQWTWVVTGACSVVGLLLTVFLGRLSVPRPPG